MYWRDWNKISLLINLIYGEMIKDNFEINRYYKMNKNDVIKNADES